jgi:signal transduction histidine kinase
MYGSGIRPFFRLQNRPPQPKLPLMRTLSSMIPTIMVCLCLLLPGAVPAVTITNLAGLQAAVQSEDASLLSYSVQLNADVWWANPVEGRLVLADDSGCAILETAWRGGGPRAGQRVRLEGNGIIAKTGGGFSLGNHGPVVDNDGVHAMIEKSGSVFLPPGRNPIQVDWFNSTEKYGLEVDWAGPELPRQHLADASLFHSQTAAAANETNFVPGLGYACYPVAGEALPDFGELMAVKTGVVSNFDLGILPSVEHVGVRFRGWLEIPREGVYTFFTKSDDGSKLFVGGPPTQLTVTGTAAFPSPQLITPGEILSSSSDHQWSQVDGLITFAARQGACWELELSTGAGDLRLEIPAETNWSPAALLNQQVRATGVAESVLTADGLNVAGCLLVPGSNQIECLLPVATATALSATNPLPRLTSCAQVHRLTREEAQCGYPVTLRGVVTCVLPEHQAFTLQDATRGLYAVDCSPTRSAPPAIGEVLEIDGRTDPSLFAPIVNATCLTSLGIGRLPTPVRPTWDQLLNGSLDAQFIELQGMITTVDTNGVTLVTREGRIKLDLRVNGLKPGALTIYEDSLVRIRGCLFASWDYVTHQVKPGEIRLYGADISVDQPPPADLFAQPAKDVAQLRLFDPQAGQVQRVKVAGQILYVNGREGYLAQGKSGLRFLTQKEPELTPGDQVQVVGFPQLSGASPVLREAVVRITGHAPLPQPLALSAEDLVRSDYDATRVSFQGVLVSRRQTAQEQILELQSGARTFFARLRGGLMNPPPIGSRLELTGTYSGLGGDLAIGQDISSFELLLDSPGDLRLLSRPPWWTLERLLIAVGALLCGLAVTALWINQLHRQVEQRTAELEVQIRARQRVEQQHLMEQERARVAQDLHDELGSSLTEISMLGARAKSAAEDKRKAYLEQMSEKARDMVTALDEIVWAMNPRHDSLASLVSYVCLYADRFLGLANILWHLEDSPAETDCIVDSRHRHQLFLAFKEALTNIVRHSGATEVRLNISRRNDEVRLAIADNGRGLSSNRTAEMDGLNNMRARLENLGGRCEITSPPGGGTIVEFHFPLSQP